VAVWGDSHAALLSQPLGTALGEKGMALQELTLSACQPIPNLLNNAQTRAKKCETFNADVMKYLIATPSLKTVILHATWGSYIAHANAYNWLGERLEDEFYSYPSSKSPSMPDEERKEAIAAELTASIKALRQAGKAVILVFPNPIPGFRAPKYLGQKVWYGEVLEDDIGFDQTLYHQSPVYVHDYLTDIADTSGAMIFDPQNLFCQNGLCYVMRNRELLYFDEGHRTLAGTALMVAPLVELVSSINGN